MKLGIVLPSFLYNQERRQLAHQGFVSMAGTESLQETSDLLLLVKNPADYNQYLEMLRSKFRIILKTDEGLDGTEMTLAYGTYWLFDNMGSDYVIWMGDDALFHPMWLWELKNLIERHPDAAAWSVYRSAYEAVHKTLEETELDARVLSICGHGMTFSRKEWMDWKVDWCQPVFCSSRGNTLDLFHAEHRPGERWVTKRSFIQHTGRVGQHCTAAIPEYGRGFAL